MKQRTGYVFKSKGKWYARVTFTGKNGKRRNKKRTAKSKAEANKKLRKLVKQLETESEKGVDTQRLTFNDLADYYETHYAKPAKIVNGEKLEGLKDFRRVRYFLKHYRKFFGKMKLRSISYDDIFVYRSARLKVLTPRKKVRTISSMNKELAYLRRMLNIALRQGWIDKNPFKCGEPLILNSYERRRERILTFEEERKLLEACDHPKREHLKSFLIALLDTGARKGEMLKLTWRDVDFKKRLITFQALNTKTLKTRQVAITQRLYEEFQTLQEKSDGRSDSLVFGIKNNVRRSFSTACKIAGIKEGGIDGLTLHCLRHTAATRLVNGQLPIQMVGRILGHTQPQTTYRYLTADQTTLFQASEILESFQNQK